MDKSHKTARRLVITINMLNKIYTANTPKIGRQSTELWLMYALDDGKPHSQKQICDEWGFPPTTLNTVTKKCETAGYLTLTLIPGKRREMQICLTESGKIHAKQLLDAVYQAEGYAMEETLKRYSTEFISALDYFGQCLKLSFEQDSERDNILLDMEEADGK